MHDLELQGHKNRKKRVLKSWLEVVTDYKNGVPAKEIAQKHTKTTAWVYWVLRKYRKGEI